MGSPARGSVARSRKGPGAGAASSVPDTDALAARSRNPLPARPSTRPADAGRWRPRRADACRGAPASAPARPVPGRPVTSRARRHRGPGEADARGTVGPCPRFRANAPERVPSRGSEPEPPGRCLREPRPGGRAPPGSSVHTRGRRPGASGPGHRAGVRSVSGCPGQGSPGCCARPGGPVTAGPSAGSLRRRSTRRSAYRLAAARAESPAARAGQAAESASAGRPGEGTVTAGRSRRLIASRTTAIHSSAEPSMCRPTRISGTSVKYCT